MVQDRDVQITNKNWCMAYPIVEIPMTLSDFQGHAPNACR